MDGTGSETMTTTKFCQKCGKIMWDVSPCKRFCDACIKEKARQKDKERRERKKAQQQGSISAKQATRPKKETTIRPRIKPFEQCVRESHKLGISYGKYVQRGYDKITWEEIL